MNQPATSATDIITGQQGPDLMSDNEATLLAGLRWLHDTEQPEGAILQHHGVVLEGVGNRRFGFIPSGRADRAIVTVDVAHLTWEVKTFRITNPLRRTELTELTAQLATLSAEVVGTWNGHPAPTGSLALARPAHPTLLAAVARYHAGCPTHSAKTVLCDCDWYTTGNALIVAPTVHEYKGAGR